MEEKKPIVRFVFSVIFVLLSIAAFVALSIMFSDALALKREIRDAGSEQNVAGTGISFAFLLIFNIIALFINTVISGIAALVSRSLFKRSNGGMKIYAGAATGVCAVSILVGAIFLLILVA